MKIAIISSGFLPIIDGVTVTLINRLRKLSEYGHKVLLFCPDYNSLEKIYPNWKDYTGNILPNVKVINLPSTSFMGLDFEQNVTRKAYQIVLKELQNFQPDIIHVDEPERLWTGFLKVPGIDFAQHAQIPCVSFFHTNLIEYIEDFFPLPSGVIASLKFILKHHRNWVYNFYDLTLVSSRVTAEKVSQFGIKNVLYENLLGFDSTQFSSQMRQEQFFEQKYGLSNVAQKVKLIFLGRLTPDKGWRFTINAFSRLMQTVNLENIAIIIAGDGSMRDEIATKLSQLTSHIYLIGKIPPDDIPALLTNSDIHVTTSEKETRGLTILEAFAAGIPVIAPRAGGVIDSIQDGWNGFLFTPKDYNDFTHKLKLLIDNPSLRQSMGINGRESVAEYSWDNAVKNLLKIWEEQIVQKSGR